MGLNIDPRLQGPVRANTPRVEDVLLAWLVSQPPGADLVAALDVELDRLARYDGRHPGPARLAGLFKELRRVIAHDAPRTALQ